MARLLRLVLKRLAFTLHRAGLRLGIHILPAHIYTPLPNILELARTRDRWARRSELPGLAVDLEEQCKLLEEICLPFAAEYRGNKTYLEAIENSFGPGYGYIEAQALHGIVRSFNPHRIVEVGSGVSTSCLLAAAARNREEKGAGGKITCVEPHPSVRLRALDGIELIARPVQEVPLSLFEGLEENDLLFYSSIQPTPSSPEETSTFSSSRFCPAFSPASSSTFTTSFSPMTTSRAFCRLSFTGRRLLCSARTWRATKGSRYCSL